MNQAVDQNTIASRTPAPVTTDKGAARDRLLIIAIALLSVGAWYVGKLELYQADSPLGYNLGLVGGVAMALLLLYPLRKRVRWMRSMLPIKYWFGAHMALGIVGPLMIMYHSNFQMESKNGAVAFYSMMAVFISGLVGRIIYRRIHFGLFGRKATLEELKQQLGMNENNIHSRFHKLPEVEQVLLRYEQRILDENSGGVIRFYRALTARFASPWTRYRSLSLLKKAIQKLGRKKGWTASERKRRYQSGKAVIDGYLETINKVAQFGLFERMFSIWHIAHVPLIFLLIATALIHVVAVHMY